MAFVTTQRWANRVWTPQRCEKGADGRPEFLVNCWGPVPIRKRLRVAVQSHRPSPHGQGRQFDLDAFTRLDWLDAKDLSPFEEKAGELAHLCEGGAHISRLTLDRRPAQWQWEHDLDYPAGVQFAYQGALTPEEIKMGASRPAAVVGSYAVYDANDCKVTHVLCPCAVGKDGRRVWGTISIVGGRSVVSFKPSDVASLKLPVTVFGLDTFGYTTAGGSDLYNSILMSCGYYTPAANGTTTSIQFHTGSTNATGKVTHGLYLNGGGANNDPTTRIVDTVEGDLTSTKGWVILNTDSAASISSASSYYVATQVPEGTNYQHISFDQAGKVFRYGGVGYVAGSTPSPFGTVSNRFDNYNMSAYVNYTPTAGAGSSRRRRLICSGAA